MIQTLISIQLWAQAEGKPAQTPEPFWMNLFLPMGILVLFYFILWRPMQKQEKERKTLLNTMKKNDRVLTSAGIYGTVVAVSDTEDELTLKVDDNTRIRMTKGSISRNFSNEEEHQAKTNGKVSS
ncbi:MAG: preprotein translocase subunit YajC [Gemmataceae bacterium]|jgi:preprotein translocase subunit YajC|nr:preprotein translocase subunit YajC [Gemmataceae bacterium]MCY2971995.1 preprotein translocase subunit YajC [Planctomycetota bacterium]MBJ7345029.1 preprotein translocase subunit YajC [Gemmataceae bacterium]MBJ7431658.1 preprotein translocase subunit YajC [Gemmataceae bacterium]MBJ7496793.1 preprotein translocase subunit YajC [Gemmataceae bacterium]